MCCPSRPVPPTTRTRIWLQMQDRESGRSAEPGDGAQPEQAAQRVIAAEGDDSHDPLSAIAGEPAGDNLPEGSGGVDRILRAGPLDLAGRRPGSANPVDRVGE